MAKIKISDIEPNPFRDLEKYPISEEGVENIRESVRSTGFWPGIILRKHPTKKGKYQQLFGHKRVEAARQEKLKEIECVVWDVDDMTALMMMARENTELAKNSNTIINETVRAGRDWLKKELQSYPNYEAFSKKSPLAKTGLLKNAEVYLRNRESGPFASLVAAFLGWKPWLVDSAAATLKDADSGILELEAVEKFPTPKQAQVFHETVRQFRVPRNQQVQLAEKLTKEGAGIREIRPRIIEIVSPPGFRPKKNKPINIHGKPIEEYVYEIVKYHVRGTRAKLSTLQGYVHHLEGEHWYRFQEECRATVKVIEDLLNEHTGSPARKNGALKEIEHRRLLG